MDQENTPTRKTLWIFAVIGVLIYALIPVIWIASLSLKTPESIGDGSFLPTHWTLHNYTTAFKTGFFTASLRNSIGIALITTVIALAFASMAAYAITRLDFPGKTAILAGALAVTMFPAISIVGGLYNVWRNIGLFDTWAGLILPYLSFSLPLSIYILSAFFREIPWDLEKAAQMDGATPLQAFWRVILPLAVPGVHRGDPHVHRGVERLPVRQRADGDQLRADRAGRVVVLHGRIAVPAACRRDRRGRGDRHRPDSDHGADLPAPHRFRPHRRGGQGLRP